MHEFIPGQRWISDTESELGLGSVIKLEGRTVTLRFEASDATRVYASANAPLTRIRFDSGDQVEDQQGEALHITSVSEQQGLLIYSVRQQDGNTRQLPESELSHYLRFNKPRDRLLTGQLDANHWFELRYHSLHHQAQLAESANYGLQGARIDLIPHQLYIAHEVAGRHAPRVLLADEVGLGKTIEACLILHQQLISGRANRALILVPSPLLHQWLVELLRRFNLHFSIFDEERCTAIIESGQASNPFHAEQLVLCSLDLFSQNPQRFSQALEGEWDLLIIDEAHHLAWSEDDPSPEYLLVEALALNTPGILLLTATPEQLGRAGHFARLRLLDPDRFHSLEAFLAEEQAYRPAAEAIDRLMQRTPLSEDAQAQILDQFGEEECAKLLAMISDVGSDETQRESARSALIELLLDRHGTGRVMFRNNRAGISGFPEREFHGYPLPNPECYDAEQIDPQQSAPPDAWLAPERIHAAAGLKEWWRTDPRVSWLCRFLRENPEPKLLLICAHAQTAIELQEALRSLEGIGAALFHEGMSIIERDRAAAWFADPNQGSRILLCSEIGSEGRNFQFAHHLVLFDLPLNPDLLEQRIGRLDRIGQQQTVRVHVPYLSPGPQERLVRWYHEGLDAFHHTVPGAHTIFSQLAPALQQVLEEDEAEAELEPLLAATAELRQQTAQRLQQGRDHLLELAGCRQPLADQIVRQIRSLDSSSRLYEYCERLFGCFGAEVEPLGNGFVLRPAEQVSNNRLPGLPDDGLTLTFDRADALAHEDRQFLTWEHPMLREAMQQVISQESGNSSAIALRHPEMKPGQLLIEALFQIECIAPAELQVGRFLPPQLIRVLVNPQGERLDQQLTIDQIAQQGEPLPPQSTAPVLRRFRKEILELISAAEKSAEKELRPKVKQALDNMMEHFTGEIQRMIALRKHNPSIRRVEIELLQQQGLTLHQQIQGARLRMDALRLIVTL
ncbi:RNA polymerase-associated protein RapA [endosymbiont of Ridgeia piscesae]|jgi:ATP-dependent helicase HepA|uniref:RNA polymerase-associated protein RapA n=1 Tax=endosymbiont of Ridgeia piscesae TaxID=54398 RepID=A0A0T5Z3G1_9GAMM|nr:RNA polymerase-associated protein RapA [endosymbiont of Ridgeia piscesae]KRT53840.1 Superfamily II DNA or RNA helicase, SNF2 family [endosymbiont of Ridgeia piscesae]KRT57022.1 ATP-dependent helicase HepA [endosymbiont of Ridgeia piscesae]